MNDIFVTKPFVRLGFSLQAINEALRTAYRWLDEIQPQEGTWYPSDPEAPFQIFIDRQFLGRRSQLSITGARYYALRCHRHNIAWYSLFGRPYLRLRQDDVTVRTMGGFYHYFHRLPGAADKPVIQALRGRWLKPTQDETYFNPTTGTIDDYHWPAPGWRTECRFLWESP